MNIYVRRNMIEQWWEMCLESDRTHWVSVMDRTSSDFMETIDTDIIRIDAMRIWGIGMDGCPILIARRFAILKEHKDSLLHRC